MSNLEINITDELIEIADDHFEVVKFLVGYFSYNLGWSVEKTKELMSSFYSLQEPFMTDVVFYDLILGSYSEYHNKYYSYSHSGLQQIYGFIDFQSPNNSKIREYGVGLNWLKQQGFLQEQ